LNVDLSLLQPSAVIEINGFQLGELFYGRRSSFPGAIARGLNAAEGQMDLCTNGGRINVSIVFNDTFRTNFKLS